MTAPRAAGLPVPAPVAPGPGDLHARCKRASRPREASDQPPVTVRRHPAQPPIATESRELKAGCERQQRAPRRLRSPASPQRIPARAAPRRPPTRRASQRRAASEPRLRGRRTRIGRRPVPLGRGDRETAEQSGQITPGELLRSSTRRKTNPLGPSPNRTRRPAERIRRSTCPSSEVPGPAPARQLRRDRPLKASPAAPTRAVLAGERPPESASAIARAASAIPRSTASRSGYDALATVPAAAAGSGDRRCGRGHRPKHEQACEQQEPPPRAAQASAARRRLGAYPSLTSPAAGAHRSPSIHRASAGVANTASRPATAASLPTAAAEEQRHAGRTAHAPRTKSRGRQRRRRQRSPPDREHLPGTVPGAAGVRDDLDAATDLLANGADAEARLPPSARASPAVVVHPPRSWRGSWRGSPLCPLFSATSMSSASAPRTSPITIRSGASAADAVQDQLADRHLARALDGCRRGSGVRTQAGWSGAELQLDDLLDRDPPARCARRCAARQGVAAASSCRPRSRPRSTGCGDRERRRLGSRAPRRGRVPSSRAAPRLALTGEPAIESTGESTASGGRTTLTLDPPAEPGAQPSGRARPPGAEGAQDPLDRVPKLLFRPESHRLAAPARAARRRSSSGALTSTSSTAGVCRGVPRAVRA